METQTDPYQIKIYRAMPPQQKYEIMQSLIDSARALKYAYFRSIHFDWTEIQQALCDCFLYARTLSCFSLRMSGSLSVQ
jgi:hypothetical protein